MKKIGVSIKNDKIKMKKSLKSHFFGTNESCIRVGITSKRRIFSFITTIKALVHWLSLPSVIIKVLN